jgi:hypothetical protein
MGSASEASKEERAPPYPPRRRGGKNQLACAWESYPTYFVSQANVRPSASLVAASL